MSGGLAYVYDPDGTFGAQCNMAMVTLEPVLSQGEQEATIDKAIWHSTVRGGEVQADEAILKGLIERHFKYTGSTRARNLLDNWVASRGKFVKVFPTEYKRALSELDAARHAAPVKEKVAA
jgi:glutamate synthase (NADPH/NADH) large chain